MPEIRTKSHALIFPGKKDNPIYKIRKDLKDIKISLDEIKNDINSIKEIIGLKNEKI